MGRPSKEIVDNCPQLIEEYKEEKTRDIAAKESGLGSSATLRRAKTVIDSGDEDIIEQMNAGEITINKAHSLVKGGGNVDLLPQNSSEVNKRSIRRNT
ncbi:hypothetical protein B5G52_04185 [Pseudoalteromonas sp. A601]|uniref:hypothetical protein n=1 Tax=Pseudoalteromonas sp. A601 TaxID=1967839 RepID=UPI000B3C28C9|nr:hypothetical protein [Pseudoalteromonas sp. A601]OUS73452.1 hypothetical protein B5G52_04185 [Pseudoalteromonas sp. A601]